jgi:hypothetical protein
MNPSRKRTLSLLIWLVLFVVIYLPLYGTGLIISAKHYDTCGSEMKDKGPAEIDNTLNTWIMVNSMIALGSGLLSLPCIFCIPTR